MSKASYKMTNIQLRINLQIILYRLIFIDIEVINLDLSVSKYAANKISVVVYE